ncbi:MAG: OmpA family protein [Elusimicrobia bacterium]|nr:OmpA family protein [Elusimicrobiota bacterium]
MKRSAWRTLLAALAAFGLGLAALAGRSLAEERTLSRQMKLAIMFYERGEDGQAMDRFMDVLTRGDAAERPLANEYINLITQRMNASGAVPGKGGDRTHPAGVVTVTDEEPAPAVVAPKRDATRSQPPEAAARQARAPAHAPAVPAGPEVVVEPDQPRMVAPEPRRGSVRRPRVEEEDESEPAPPQVRKPSREAVEKDIRAKIRAVFTRNLEKLRETEEIQVAIGPDGNPEAIGIPTPILFQSGIAFKKTAKPILDALTGIVYSLKNAQIVILPEGTSIGDPKVLDMRRTMGISSHLFSAGISPARVRVNLLSSQVETPKALKDYRGILLVFVYNRPLDLVMESVAAHDAGPTMSLGVFPDRLNPGLSEGAVIEFSVIEPPAGLASWRFRLLRPSLEEGEDLAPLNDVVGSGPVFHQIFWNGRKSYFGDPLPAGRYECVLTATDAKNRSRTLHRWIQLGGAAQPPGTPRSAARSQDSQASDLAIGRSPAGPPPADLGAVGGEPQVDAPETLVKGVTIGAAPAAKRPARPKKVRRVAAGAKKEEAGPAPAPAAGAKGPFEIAFDPESSELRPQAEQVVDQIGEALATDKKSSIDITGHARGTGLEAAALAKKRAGDVADRLMRKHGVPPERIQIQSSASEADKVEVRLTAAP